MAGRLHRNHRIRAPWITSVGAPIEDSGAFVRRPGSSCDFAPPGAFEIATYEVFSRVVSSHGRQLPAPFPRRSRYFARYPGHSRPAGDSPSPWKRVCPSPRPSKEHARRHTVWLTPLHERLTSLARAGLDVRWQEDYSRSHHAVADVLIDAFAADAAHMAAPDRARALGDLPTAHRIWRAWRREGRVRKITFVAEKTEAPRPTTPRRRDRADRA